MNRFGNMDFGINGSQQIGKWELSVCGGRGGDKFTMIINPHRNSTKMKIN